MENAELGLLDEIKITGGHHMDCWAYSKCCRFCNYWSIWMKHEMYVNVGKHCGQMTKPEVQSKIQVGSWLAYWQYLGCCKSCIYWPVYMKFKTWTHTCPVEKCITPEVLVEIAATCHTVNILRTSNMAILVRFCYISKYRFTSTCLLYQQPEMLSKFKEACCHHYLTFTNHAAIMFKLFNFVKLCMQFIHPSIYSATQ